MLENIARQFEFVHHTWINNPTFDGLYDDADPLLGAHHPYGGTFTLQARPVRTRIADLPRFVHVRGGAYFFLPGFRALRSLARSRRQSNTASPVRSTRGAPLISCRRRARVR